MHFVIIADIIYITVTALQGQDEPLHLVTVDSIALQ